MKKIEDEKKEALMVQWLKAVQGYLCALLEAWELSSYYGYWIGGEIGSLYDYGGSFTITMDNIIYCVEHDVTHDQYMEWQEYCCDAAEFNFTTPNLRSWMAGCPRTPEATFENLRALKAELNNAIDEENERVKNEGAAIHNS